MANTYTQIYIMIVFAVKGRMNLINENIEEELYKYITGIVNNRDHKLLQINGDRNHLHVFVSIKPKQSISDLVRDIKSNSAKFINEKKWFVGKFHWQSGFGAFSYSKSQVNTVIKYIADQKEHHKRKTFNDEYVELLKQFGIDFENKYLFD